MIDRCRIDRRPIFISDLHISQRLNKLRGSQRWPLINIYAKKNQLSAHRLPRWKHPGVKTKLLRELVGFVLRLLDYLSRLPPNGLLAFISGWLYVELYSSLSLSIRSVPHEHGDYREIYIVKALARFGVDFKNLFLWTESRFEMTSEEGRPSHNGRF